MDRRELLVGLVSYPFLAGFVRKGSLTKAPRDTDGPEWDRWLEEYEKCGGESS